MIGCILLATAALTFENPVIKTNWPDPTFWQDGEGCHYGVASGLAEIRQSRDLVHWDPIGPVESASCRSNLNEFATTRWAPDFVKIGDEYRIYVTQFVSSDTNRLVCLSSKVPTGPFEFRSVVLENWAFGIRDLAIDSEVVVDGDKVWLFTGSVAGGIHRFELTADGLSLKTRTPVHVAGLLPGGHDRKWIYSHPCYEGAYLYRRDGWWYLFVSAGSIAWEEYHLCCGRSRTLDGDFVDSKGVSLAKGGGDVLLVSNEMFPGPGHNGEIVTDKAGRDYMFFHSHWAAFPQDFIELQRRCLNLQRLYWNKDGWPYFETGSVKKTEVAPVCLAIPGALAGSDDAASPSTYCNPLSLPDYSCGTFAQADEFQAQLGAPELVSKNGPYREAGDPAVIVEKGVWYLYVSGVMPGCWKSADRGATWQRIDNGLPPFALGYAPTVVKFRGKFLACGGWGAKKGTGALYRADSPEGPFAFVGRLKPPRNDGAPNCADPMLFADGDRLYFYWGCTPDKGIWGCELDPEDPLKALTPAKRLVAYDPEHQPWEKFPNRPFGFVEGAWMFKRNGGYYLMFAAGGTEFPTYATGVARGTSPLGEFVLQKNNPVFFSPSGVVTGTAHGSVVRDDRDDWWYFYTVHASIRHRFERRIGMDRLTFDANGDIVARSASSEPQPLSGAFPEGCPWRAVEGVCYSAGAAFDRSLRTEFVPVKLPYEVEFEFLRTEDVRAHRVIWSAEGPVGYRIELKGTDGKWMTALDATGNATDLLVDYRELAKARAKAARLTVVSAPNGVLPRLVEWTLFADERCPGKMSAK